MSYSKATLAKAAQTLESRRKKAQRTQTARHLAVTEKIPVISKYEAQLSETGLSVVKAIGMGSDAQEYINQLSQLNLAVQDKIRSLLKENGFPVIYGLTNWSAETFPPVREKYKIFSLIDHIVCSGEENLLKPDPKIYQTLLDRYNLKAEESLFIDDNVNNVKGAIDMGMKSIRFVNAEQLQKDLKEMIG